MNKTGISADNGIQNRSTQNTSFVTKNNLNNSSALKIKTNLHNKSGAALVGADNAILISPYKNMEVGHGIVKRPKQSNVRFTGFLQDRLIKNSVLNNDLFKTSGINYSNKV